MDGIPVSSPYHSGLRSGAWNPTRSPGSSSAPIPPSPWMGSRERSWRRRSSRETESASAGSSRRPRSGSLLDGPLVGPSGFVLAGRTGFPGLIRPPDEPSYIDGEDHDLLAKLSVAAGSGELRVLAFDNRNVVRASSRPSEISDEAAGPGPQNRYAWHGRSLGLTWDGLALEGAPLAPCVAIERGRVLPVVRGGFLASRERSRQYGIQGSLDWGDPGARPKSASGPPATTSPTSCRRPARSRSLGDRGTGTWSRGSPA